MASKAKLTGTESSFFVNASDPVLRVAWAQTAHMLSRLNMALEKEAITGGIAFYPGPDLSFSSNANRTRDGFVYGGVLVWYVDRPVVFPGVRPSGCGVLFCELGEENNEDRALSRVIRARDRFSKTWDYDKGNHFIALYQDSSKCRYGLLHGGTALAKDITRPSQSCYPEINSFLREKIRRVETPLGSVDLLVDGDAIEYYENFKRLEAILRSDREELCQLLWPESKLLVHATHQGLHQPNLALLGAYLLSNRDNSAAYPIMVGPGEDLLLCENGVSMDHVPRLAINEENIPSDIEHEMIPHGSGDTYNDVDEITTEYHDLPVISVLLKNRSRVLFGRLLPTPNYRPALAAAQFLEQFGRVKYETLKHVLTYKI